MKPGKNIRPVSRLEVIGTLAGAGIEALGFASIPLTEKLGLSEPLRVGICLFLALIGVVVILFTSFVGQGKAFPLKKILVCALILVVGTVLAGLLAAVAGSDGTAFVSGGFGWLPVSSGVMTVAIPLVISIAVCIWYWETH